MSANVEEIDFNRLAAKITALPQRVESRHFHKIAEAFDILKEIPFPPGFVDHLYLEVTQTLRKGEDQRECAYVYLAFYGVDNKASHLKVGVAKNVKNRLSGIKTGNPLPNLWTYCAKFFDRRTALEVEAALLENMSQDSVHGEWVRVHGLSEDAALAIVGSLEELAVHISKQCIRFLPQDVIQ